MNKKVSKYLFVCFSLNIIGAAVALILESGLGCDPIGLLCDGMAHFFSISFGMASFFYNSIIIGAALVVARQNLGMGTIAYGLLSGFFIDFYRMLLSDLSLGSRGTVIAVIVFVVGEILMSFAFAILMQLQLGMTALDALLVTIGKIVHIPYAYIKIGTDILLVISGIWLGGVFGIGTIISALSTGILVMKVAKIIKHFQGDFDVYSEDSNRSLAVRGNLW